MTPLQPAYPRPDIAVVTLDRHEKLNALNYELVEDLHTTLAEIGESNECRVVVLTGAGPASAPDWISPTPSRRTPPAASSSRDRACAGRNASPTSPRRYSGCANR